MQGGDHFQNAGTATLLDMDGLLLSSSNKDSGTKHSTIGTLLSDDGSSINDWSIYCPINGIGNTTTDVSTNADADWAMYSDRIYNYPIDSACNLQWLSS